MAGERVYWHVTFHPCRRSPALWDDVEGCLYQSIDEVAKRLEITIVKVVAMPDHVHLLIEMPPWVDLIKAIGQIKGYTARRILERFPGLQFDMGSRGLWARGYHYTRHTESSLPVVLSYLANQKAKGGLE